MKRHPFDLISAFFGAVFATMGILLLARHGLEPRHLEVVGPALVIAAGVALLASVVRASRTARGPVVSNGEGGEALVEEAPPEP